MSVPGKEAWRTPPPSNRLVQDAAALVVPFGGAAAQSDARAAAALGDPEDPKQRQLAPPHDAEAGAGAVRPGAEDAALPGAVRRSRPASPRAASTAHPPPRGPSSTSLTGDSKLKLHQPSSSPASESGAGIATAASATACTAAALRQGLAGTSGTMLLPARAVFPTADPDYDEALSADAANAAAKYGGVWLRAVLPYRAPREHPLQAVVVRHVDGSMDLVRPYGMRPLVAGCPLYTRCEAVLEATHPQLPAGLWYLAGNLNDWGTADARYLTAHFAAPGRLLVLLPEGTVEPRWLREHFFKLREPLYGNKVRLPMRWHSGALFARFVALLSATPADRRSDAHVLVFESKRVYRAGDSVSLGGLPTAHFADDMYVLAAHAVEQGEDAAAAQQQQQQQQHVQVQVAAGLERDSAGPGGATASVTAAAGGRPPHGPPLTDAPADWPLWLGRMLKAVRRNRLDDARALLKSEAWTHRPLRSDPLSWLPLEEVGTGPDASPLTSDLAGSAAMLALLVGPCRCELSGRGLRLLVHKWEEMPAEYGGALELLLSYLRRCSRPLGSLACMLTALRREVAARERSRSSSTLELRAVLRRFQELQTYLLEALADVARQGDADGGVAAGKPSLSLAWLQAIMDPPPHPPPVALADHSPLRIAFEDRDFGFMASVVMEAYTRQKWLGAAYMALTPRDGTRELTLLDPLLLHSVLRRLGLCGEGLLSEALEGVVKLWYLGMVTPGAFIASPRGRWWMRLMAQVVFIAVYNESLTISHTEAGMRMVTSLTTTMVAFLAGALVEMLETLAYTPRSGIARYLKRNLLFLAGDLILFVLTTVHLVYINNGVQLDVIVYFNFFLLWASLAVVVYLKFLYTLVPLFSRLGPLLNTVSNMLTELIAFMLPFVVITAGFATTLFLVYNDVPDATTQFPTFLDAMVYLFSAFLGTFDLTDFDDMPIPQMRTFGKALMIVYLLIAGVLLANLLIAIISYKYRPDEVASQTVFGLAEVVDAHQAQVDHATLCAPFCLFQVPLNLLLPRGTRPAILPYAFFRAALAPLEGFRPAAPHLSTVPTGRDAVPQLFFHLTAHAVMLIASAAAFFALAPLCVVYFAFAGHKRVWDKLWDSSGGGGGSGGAGGGGGGGRTRGRRSGGGGAVSTLGGSASVAAGSVAVSHGAASSGSRGRFSGSFGSDAAGSVGRGAAGGDPYAGFVARVCSLRGLLDALAAAGRVAAAACVGVVLYCGAVGFVLVLLGGLYTWAACVALSIYNILYEPAVRLGRALHLGCRRRRDSLLRWWRRSPAVAAEEHAGAHGGDGGGGGGDGGESDVGSEAGGASVTGGGARTPRRKLTAVQVAQRWSQLAAVAAHRRGAATGYLSPAQVDAAIVRVFGYNATETQGLAAADAAGAASGGGSAFGGRYGGYDSTYGGGAAGGGAAGRPRSSLPRRSVFAGGRPGSALVARRAVAVDSIHNIRTPHHNLLVVEEQQEAKDMSLLGRQTTSLRQVSIAAQRAAQAPGTAAGDGGGGDGPVLHTWVPHRHASRQPLLRGSVAGTPRGAAESGSGAAVAAAPESGPAEPQQPQVQVQEQEQAQRQQVLELLQQIQASQNAQASELAELRAEVMSIKDVIDVRLQDVAGADERRRAVLARAYGDENY